MWPFEKLVYAIFLISLSICGLQASGAPSVPAPLAPLSPLPPLPPLPPLMQRPCTTSSQCYPNECCKSSEFKSGSPGGYCAPVGLDSRQCLQDSRSCYSDQQCQYNGCCVKINPYAIPSCIYDPYICSMKNPPPTPYYPLPPPYYPPNMKYHQPPMPPFYPPPHMKYPPPPPPHIKYPPFIPPPPHVKYIQNVPPPQIQFPQPHIKYSQPLPPPPVPYVYPPMNPKKCSHSFECGHNGCCFYDDLLRESRCIDLDAGKKDKDDRPFPLNLLPNNDDDRPFPFNLLPRNSNGSGNVNGTYSSSSGSEMGTWNGNVIVNDNGNVNENMNMNANMPTGRKSSGLGGLLPLIPLVAGLFKYPPSLKCLL